MNLIPNVSPFSEERQNYTAQGETLSNGKTDIKITKAKGLDILTIIAVAAAVIGGAIIIDRKLEEHL